MPSVQQTISRRAAAGAMRGWLKLRYQVLSRRYDRLVLETINGVPLLILPKVFNPVLLRSGAIMARSLRRLAPQLSKDTRVLDLGSGSGVGGIFAALAGAQVVALDINPEAVRCTRINALLNGVEPLVEVVRGDLFEPVAQRRFDVILFNLPYYRGVPKDDLDRAWRAQDVFERFTAQLADRLTPTGQAVLVLSTDGDCDQLLALLNETNFSIATVEETDLINEVVTVYSVRPRGAP